MRLSHASLLVIALVACGTPEQPDTTTTQEVDSTAARIEAFMQRQVEAGFSGNLLVMRKGEVVVEQGYGLRDREAGLPNVPGTVHAIGSITKQFTAAAILELERTGKLSVNDLMSKYVANVPKDKEAITLHHLLTHSAGFPGAIGDDYAPIGREQFLQLAMLTPLEFAPGTGYGYSNVGYSILGAIVEHVSGEGYEAFLRDQLLAPAGLKRTGYLLPGVPRGELAVGYAKGGSRWGTMLDHPQAADGPYWHLRCNGGLLSTARDMYDWTEALRTHRVLDSSAVRRMWTPYVQEGEGADSHYGYGWAIFTTPRGTKLVTHNGGNGIQFADVLCYVDEGVTVVLMSNANVRGQQNMAWEVGRMVFDPAYVAEVRAAAPEVLPGLPADAFGDRLRALSTIIAKGGGRCRADAVVGGEPGSGLPEGHPDGTPYCRVQAGA